MNDAACYCRNQASFMVQAVGHTFIRRWRVTCLLPAPLSTYTGVSLHSACMFQRISLILMKSCQCLLTCHQDPYHKPKRPTQGTDLAECRQILPRRFQVTFRLHRQFESPL